MKFFVRIGADGSAKWTYLEESELGDRETEKCLLDVVHGRAVAQARRRRRRGSLRRWSSPLQATRPPNDWGSDKVAAALGKQGDAIDVQGGGARHRSARRCTSGPGGKVLAAGGGDVEPRTATSKADCLAEGAAED